MEREEQMAKETSKIISIGDKKVKINIPTIGMGTEADLEYSKAYTKAIQNGILPRAAMEKIILANKVWTVEDDQKILEINGRVEEVITNHASETDKDKKLELRLEFDRLRNELLDMTTKRQTLFLHTAEAKGEEAKIANLMWKCVVNEDGSRIWKTYEDFANDTDISFASQAMQEFVAFTSGLEERIQQIEDIFKDEEETKEEKVETPTEETPSAPV